MVGSVMCECECVLTSQHGSEMKGKYVVVRVHSLLEVLKVKNVTSISIAEYTQTLSPL